MSGFIMKMGEIACYTSCDIRIEYHSLPQVFFTELI